MTDYQCECAVTVSCSNPRTCCLVINVLMKMLHVTRKHLRVVVATGDSVMYLLTTELGFSTKLDHLLIMICAEC